MPETKPLTTQDERRCHSELFTVRVWREQLNDHFEWRGKIQHVTSGEAHYFRDWETLLARLQEMLNTDEV